MAENGENGARRRPGRGRPKWQPPSLKEVENLAARGLSLEQIARTLGIGVSTLYARQRDYSDFSQAVKTGRARGIMIAANYVFETITGAVKTKDGEREIEVKTDQRLEAAIFYLKTRGGWRDHDAASVQVNIGTGVADGDDVEQARQEHLKLLSQLTVDERRQIRDVLQRADRRLKGGDEIEADATLVDDGNEGEGGNGAGGNGAS